MIVLLNSPSTFELLLARILLAFKIPVYTLGSSDGLRNKMPLPMTFSKKDKIGYLNHFNSGTVNSVLNSSSIEKALLHFSEFFDPITEAKEKLKHAHASHINFFFASKVNFFLRNEIECGQQVILLFDTNFSSFIKTPSSLLGKRCYHVYIPFLDIVKIFRLINRYLFNKLKNFTLSRNETRDYKINTWSAETEKKDIAIFFHQGQVYGKLYRKDHYYSSDPSSMLHETRIQKLSYRPDSDPQIRYVRPDFKIKDVVRVFRAIPIRLIFSSFDIRALKEILIITKIYAEYLAWRNVIPALRIQGVVYDYDILFPKALSLALESFEIKTCSLQERPISMFYNSHSGVIVDAYFAAGEIFKKYADRKKDLVCANEIISYIPWRLKFFEEIPGNGGSLETSGSSVLSQNQIVFIGYFLDQSDQYPVTCTRANEEFLSYVVSCSKRYPNYRIIIRMKILDEEHLSWFDTLLSGFPNISLSRDYADVATYEICRDSNLVISLQSSLVEECVAYGKKVVLIDDLFTVNNLCSGIYPEEFQFMISRSLVDFEERVHRLLEDSRFLEHEYSELRKKILGNYSSQPLQSIPEILEYFFSGRDRAASAESILS